jgi:hypothetical protein
MMQMDDEQSELSIDDSLFVGVTYDLSQPIYLGDRDYDTLVSEAPEAAYLINVHYRVDILSRRFESLNIIYRLLSFNDFPVSTPAGSISREHWVRIALDVLLSRLTSIRDCSFLLIADVFELGLEPKNVSRSQLKKHPTILSVPSLADLIEDIANSGRRLRDERDLHLHRGEERPLGQDPYIYYAASMIETFGRGVQGTDASGNPIDLENDHRQIIEQLESEFTAIAKEFNSKIHELFDLMYPYFKERFLDKLAASGNPSQGAKSLIKRAEYYHEHYSKGGSAPQ